jgi:RNA polymerase sigma-70 factor (ECF subfamily)
MRNQELCIKPPFALPESRLKAVQADPDASLIRRVQQGDMLAFEMLVEKYKQPIINLLSRILSDATEAEDVAQNTFVQVFKSARRYQYSAKFSTWLYTIARNLCLNELRRRSRHPVASMDSTTTDQGGQTRQWSETPRDRGAPEVLMQEELRQKIEESLATLPENQRTALLLCREEEMSYNEIAAVLGTSLAATKSLIHRGRESLKQKLRPYLQTGAWHRPAAAHALRVARAGS